MIDKNIIFEEIFNHFRKNMVCYLHNQWGTVSFLKRTVPYSF